MKAHGIDGAIEKAFDRGTAAHHRQVESADRAQGLDEQWIVARSQGERARPSREEFAKAQLDGASLAQETGFEPTSRGGERVRQRRAEFGEDCSVTAGLVHQRST